MAYKSYSQRKTQVVADTTASDLFDELVTGKALNAQEADSTSSTAKQRSRVKSGDFSLAPEECPPPKMHRMGTEEGKTAKESTSWSKRKYEYSFLPRSNTSKRSSVKANRSKPPPSSKMAVFDVMDDEENEELASPGKPSPTPSSRFKPSKSKTSNSANYTEKKAVQSDSKSSSKVAKSQKKKSAKNSNDDTIFMEPSTKSDGENSLMLQENSQSNGSNKLTEVQDDSESVPHTTHTVTQSTTSTRSTGKRRGKRLNSNSKSNSSKRPCVENIELLYQGSKVIGESSSSRKIISEIATRTRSSSRTEEVVKSPLDELLESPAKKPSDGEPSSTSTGKARDYGSSLYRPSIKIASPVKQVASRATSDTDSRVKSKSSKEQSSNDSKKDIPTLRKASSDTSTLTVPSIPRTTSWPRQHSSTTSRADSRSKQGVGVSSGSIKLPRKYSFFNQSSAADDDAKDDLRPQRQYSFVHNVTTPPGDGVESGGVRGVTVSSEKANQEPTIVRNVRQAHECLEVGENQEFFDEVRYLLGSIKPSAPLKSRCLGTLNLAEQFLKRDFSQQLRSQGFTSKIMTLLKDSLQYPTLCLCTAVLFYVITRDKMNSDWTKDGVKVLFSMLSMTSWTLDSDDSDPKAEREMLRMRQKSKVILQKTVATKPMDETDEEGSQEEKEDKPQSSEPPEFEIDVENFTISELARETLTSLTAPHHKPQALRNQLRVVGALDRLANMVIECSDGIPGLGHASLLSGCGLEADVERKLVTLERCLKVLENCTLLNCDNQSYLVVFDGSVLVSRLVKLVKACFNLLPSSDHAHSSQAPCHALLSVFKLVLNLTHDNELGCDRMGGEEGVMNVLLDCVLLLPDLLSEGHQFDIIAPALGVLINLTEHSSQNRRLLELTKVKGRGGEIDETDELLLVQKNIGFHGNDLSLRALIELFLKHYRKAESASIAVPSPQRLSQLSSSPHPSPKTGNHIGKVQSSNTARRDLSATFATRLKTTSVKSSSQNSQDSQGSDGLGWLPSNSVESDQSDEEEYESIQTDPMVYSREEFDTALHQAGRHLEDSVIASYTALLIGILVKHNCDCVELVRRSLPSGSFSEMTGMLKKFVSFMNMTGSTTGLDSIRHIIRYLQEL